MMARHGSIVLIFTLALGLSSIARAEAPLDSGWSENPYFTSQTWNFSTDQTNPIPDEYQNPQTPILKVGTSHNPVHFDVDPDEGTRQGCWGFEGPIDPKLKPEPLLQFDIPNTPGTELVKKIWFQMSLDVHMDDPWEQFFLKALSVDNMTFYDYELVDFSFSDDEDDHFAEVTVEFQLDHQPAEEAICFWALLNEGDWVLFDRVKIETQCFAVPEPTSMALLAMLGLGLILRKRK